VFVTGANDKAALQVEIGKIFWGGERGERERLIYLGKIRRFNPRRGSAMSKINHILSMHVMEGERETNKTPHIPTWINYHSLATA
jgi:hypothetical protein